MTVLCITTEGLPGIRPCSHLGQHRVTCPDHDGWAERPGICRGCLPRSADRGFLCAACWDRLDNAWLRWPQFERLVLETDGRAVSPEGGGIKGSTPDGYTNLPLTVLTLDECNRHLRSRGDRTLDAWVHTEDGAADAIQFAHAAQRAYQSLEVEKRELKLERVRCPHCGMLSLMSNPTRQQGAATIVDCQHCGRLLDTIRDTEPRWVGSETCSSTEPLEHLHCQSVHCRCDCHHLGRASQVVGIAALWDADMATGSPASAPRGDWIITDPTTIQPKEDTRGTAAA